MWFDGLTREWIGAFPFGDMLSEQTVDHAIKCLKLSGIKWKQIRDLTIMSVGPVQGNSNDD